MRQTTGCSGFTEGQKNGDEMGHYAQSIINESILLHLCKISQNGFGVFLPKGKKENNTVAVKKNSQPSNIDQNHSIHARQVSSSPLVDKKLFMYMDALLC